MILYIEKPEDATGGTKKKKKKKLLELKIKVNSWRIKNQPTEIGYTVIYQKGAI